MHETNTRLLTSAKQASFAEIDRLERQLAQLTFSLARTRTQLKYARQHHADLCDLILDRESRA